MNPIRIVLEADDGVGLLRAIARSSQREHPGEGEAELMSNDVDH